jgi:hypothetical protein
MEKYSNKPAKGNAGVWLLMNKGGVRELKETQEDSQGDTHVRHILTVANLTVLGFTEAEVRHCLRAANGKSRYCCRVSYNRHPPGIAQPGSTVETPSGNRSSGQPLEALRNHPWFNDLHRLVQSNPQMLPQVLIQIGQQQPKLLQKSMPIRLSFWK